MSAIDPLFVAFTREADAIAVRDAIAAALGYPLPAVPTGDGRHASVAVTRVYSEPVAHPDGTRWALLADAVTAPLLPVVRAALPNVAIGEPEALDASWWGAS